MKHAQKGFTLIEIMIVVAIIAILAAIAIPNFVSYRKTSQMNACIANLKALDTATEAYRIRKNTPDAMPKMDDLCDPSGTDTTGKYYFKKTIACPSTGTYTAPTKVEETWTCSLGTDTDYPHKAN